MKQTLLAALTNAAPCFAAPSAARSFEGHYTSRARRLDQSLQIKRRPDGRMTVDLSVATRGCAGEMAGPAQVVGDALVARPDDASDQCRITIRQQGASLRVEEKSCLTWHGAACEFSGVYRRGAE